MVEYWTQNGSVDTHREVRARYEQANSKRVKMSARPISTSGDKSFASLRLFLRQAGHLRLRPRSVLARK